MTRAAELLVVGPGGPYAAMRECAAAFGRGIAAEVQVVKGPPERWLDQRADLIYGGFPKMLSDFAAAHPEAVDPTDICEIYKRRVGILVRPGNPRHLLTLDELAREGAAVMDVELEEMGEFHARAPGLRDRLAVSVLTGDDGARAWRTMPDLDAWITFESWQRAMPGGAEFVPLPEEIGSVRSTVIATTRWSEQQALALDFISFSRSPRAHAVFRKRGWL